MKNKLKKSTIKYKSKSPMNYQTGGQPTAQDSLLLYNNSRLVDKYYNDKKYEKLIENQDSPSPFYHLDEFAEMYYRDNHESVTRNGYEHVKDYRVNIDKNKFKQRESANSILDTRSPMQMYDRRISPTKIKTYTNVDKNDIIKGDNVNIYGYDNAFVAPESMVSKLSAEERKRRTQYKTSREYRDAKKQQLENINSKTVPPVYGVDQPRPKPKPQPRPNVSVDGINTGINPVQYDNTPDVDMKITQRPGFLKKGETKKPWDGVPNMDVIYEKKDGQLVPAYIQNKIGQRMGWNEQNKLTKEFQYPGSFAYGGATPNYQMGGFPQLEQFTNLNSQWGDFWKGGDYFKSRGPLDFNDSSTMLDTAVKRNQGALDVYNNNQQFGRDIGASKDTYGNDYLDAAYRKNWDKRNPNATDADKGRFDQYSDFNKRNPGSSLFDPAFDPAIQKARIDAMRDENINATDFNSWSTYRDGMRGSVGAAWNSDKELYTEGNKDAKRQMGNAMTNSAAGMFSGLNYQNAYKEPEAINLQQGFQGVQYQHGGNMNMTGYTPNTPTANNKVNTIPGSNIDMSKVSSPIVGIADNGYTQIMQPGQQYTYGYAKNVNEIPMDRQKMQQQQPMQQAMMSRYGGDMYPQNAQMGGIAGALASAANNMPNIQDKYLSQLTSNDINDPYSSMNASAEFNARMMNVAPQLNTADSNPYGFDGTSGMKLGTETIAASAPQSLFNMKQGALRGDNSSLMQSSPASDQFAANASSQVDTTNILTSKGDPWEYQKVGGVWKTRRRGGQNWITAKDNALASIENMWGTGAYTPKNSNSAVPKKNNKVVTNTTSGAAKQYQRGDAGTYKFLADEVSYYDDTKSMYTTEDYDVSKGNSSTYQEFLRYQLDKGKITPYEGMRLQKLHEKRNVNKKQYGGNIQLPKLQFGGEINNDHTFPIHPITEEFMEIQTEYGETIMLPDGTIVNVKASDKHKQMDKDEVTDILPEGAYVFSADPKMKFSIDSKIGTAKVEDMHLGQSVFEYKENEITPGPEKIYIKDVFFGNSKKELTTAEISNNIKKKFELRDQKNDFFVDRAVSENKGQRVEYLSILKAMNEFKKPKSKREVPKAQYGMDVSSMLPMQSTNNALDGVMGYSNRAMDPYKRMDNTKLNSFNAPFKQPALPSIPKMYEDGGSVPHAQLGKLLYNITGKGFGIGSHYEKKAGRNQQRINDAEMLQWDSITGEYIDSVNRTGNIDQATNMATYMASLNVPRQAYDTMSAQSALQSEGYNRQRAMLNADNYSAQNSLGAGSSMARYAGNNQNLGQYLAATQAGYDQRIGNNNALSAQLEGSNTASRMDLASQGNNNYNNMLNAFNSQVYNANVTGLGNVGRSVGTANANLGNAKYSTGQEKLALARQHRDAVNAARQQVTGNWEGALGSAGQVALMAAGVPATGASGGQQMGTTNFNGQQLPSNFNSAFTSPASQQFLPQITLPMTNPMMNPNMQYRNNTFNPGATVNYGNPYGTPNFNGFNIFGN